MENDLLDKIRTKEEFLEERLEAGLFGSKLLRQQG